MKKILLWCTLLLTCWFSAQTVLINPSTDGGFESGSTLSSNGWSSVVPTTDIWVVGSAPTPTSANCAYISSNNGTSWTYSQLSTYSHLYRDVTVPTGELKGKLMFDWKVGGEGTTTSDWDNLKIFLVPITTTPISTAAVTGGTQLSGPGAVSGMYKLSSAAWNSETINFAFPSAGAWRIVFSWKSDISTIANPPAAIDNISLTSSLPGNFISVASGNWGTAATWDANAVPTAADNVTVSTGHTVTIDAAGQAANNLTILGTLAYATTPASFGVNGNLNVNGGGVLNVFNATTGKTLTVKGNIVNDGIIDISVGSTTAGNLTLNGTTVQTVSGTGTFNTGVIRNLTFANTNTATPNVIWSFNDIKIAYNLNMTGARVNLGTNKMTFGNNAAGSTLTAPVGTGFLPGGKFSRYWSATATGSTVTAGSDPTTATSRYPFINAAGKDRSMYITRTSATGAVAGQLAVVYTDASTMTTGLSIADGAYTVTNRYDGNWSVSNEGTVVSAASYTVVLLAPGAYMAGNGNSRIIAANAAIGGTHQNGTTTPGAQRVTIPQADLLAGPLYMGIANNDIPVLSVASGDWNNGATWSSGVVPSCTDVVQIVAGTTVTVNSAANIAKSVSIASTGTLVVASGDLTVGCTLNNNFLTNSGTLTVSGGVVNVNGNLANTANSTFNQSGGNININGNSGTAATSVDTGTAMFSTANPTTINATAGNITIVNPHHSSYAIATSNNRSINIHNAAGNNYFSGTHTFILGDGVSNLSGTAEGFVVETYSSGYTSINNLTVNGGNATGRWCSGSNNNSTLYGLFIKGKLLINSGSEYRTVYTTSPLEVAGEITNNGTFTNNSTNFKVGNLATGYNAPATTNISGSGVWANATASPTASLVNITFNNSNDVTLNVPLSVSGTLTLTAGKVNTTATNLLTLGTATAAGTLSGGSNTAYINGPFARTIASANANTNFILFPVGKTAYAPISLAPATTAVTNMKAEAFDSNTGTSDATIVAGTLSTTRRWEAPLVSGAITNMQVKLGDAGITSSNIPVQAPSASGVYTNSFGSSATYAASTATTPNTIQSTTAVLAANYTGFLSYAKDISLATADIAMNEKTIKVYPNPFTDILNISDIKDVNSVSVTDMSGRIVRTISKPTAQIQLGDLNAGLYLITLKYKDGTSKTVKAIKK